MPAHVAVIPDGNRRWAVAHNQSLDEAYRLGSTRVGQLLEWCEAGGVHDATVWALSRDNLLRHPGEVAAVLEAVTDGLRAIAATSRWPIRLIGPLDDLPAQHVAQLRAIAHDTTGAPGCTLTVALAYDGRQDIVQAVRALVAQEADADLDDAARTERLLSRYLSTTGQRDPDLVIRTSGEQRLSGFMPWQTAYSELYFCDTPWPAFEERHFQQALDAFAARTLRFGR
ncbi:polyprenyl diphosphate synthase [Streptomyces sp. NPDC048384]|uniref:polyprenyl diphosphate synthase n=1 Tax=Streptomyces sp. NPDC048384 TaxID=3155487 RepID=UPI00344121F3